MLIPFPFVTHVFIINQIDEERYNKCLRVQLAEIHIMSSLKDLKYVILKKFRVLNRLLLSLVKKKIYEYVVLIIEL